MLYTIEQRLRNEVKACYALLYDKNNKVFTNTECTISTQKMIYQIVDDRLHEVAFPNTEIHRY